MGCAVAQQAHSELSGGDRGWRLAIAMASNGQEVHLGCVHAAWLCGTTTKWYRVGSRGALPTPEDASIWRGLAAWTE